MRNLFLNCFLLAATIILLPTKSFGVDPRPIERKIENSDIMARVQLIGVIAGGATKTSGIAVIKDSVTGRTYAIKTGDSLPGVPHIKLTSVRRGEAVFNGANKEYLVRLTNSAVVQDTNESADVSGDTNKDVGPGLLNRWYEGRVAPEKESTKESTNQSTNQSYLTPIPIPEDPNKQAPGPMVTGTNELPKNQRDGSGTSPQDSRATNYLNDPSTNRLADRESNHSQTVGEWSPQNDVDQTSDSDVDQPSDDEGE